MNTNQLIRWNDRIDRRDFVIWGCLLFAVKYNLDRLVAISMDRSWYITDYFIHADRVASRGLSAEDNTFYLILVLQSLPFIWFGTVLCVQRLRSSSLPLWLVIFFFIPFVNLLMFAILSTVPPSEEDQPVRKNFLDSLIPESRLGSAAFAVGVVLIIALGITGLLINYLADYGWSLFIGIPFFLGFGSVLFYGYRKRLLYRQACMVAFTSVMLFNAVIFVLALEGILCIGMALPLLLIIAWIGATIGFAIHDREGVTMQVFMVPITALPILGAIEHKQQATPSTVQVTTEIIIHASRQEVWNQLVAFSHIDEPTEWLFKTGIAYPIHAEIEGKGQGAVRKCNFTTGSFIEPITIWDEPYMLEFGVLDQPPPLVEWSVYPDLQIAHLDGYFRSVKGQFKLDEMSDGSTRLSGTTWYYHDIWPSMYWNLWSDYILHRIHFRVLSHIKQQAEH